MYQFHGAQGQHPGHAASSPNAYHPQQPNLQFSNSPTWPEQQVAQTQQNGATGERRASEPGVNSQPCFNCGNIGHWAQDCPEPRRRMPLGHQQPNRHPFKRQRTEPTPAQGYQVPNSNGNFQHHPSQAPQRNQTHPLPGQSWTYRAPQKPPNSGNAWQQSPQAQTPTSHMNQQWNIHSSVPANASYGQQTPAQFAPNSTGQPGQPWNNQHNQHNQHNQTPGSQYGQQSANQYGQHPAIQYGQQSSQGQQPLSQYGQPNQYGQQQSNPYGQQTSDQYNQQNLNGVQLSNRYGQQPSSQLVQQSSNRYSQAPAHYSQSPASQYPQSLATQYPQASPDQYFQSPGALDQPTDAHYQQQHVQHHQQAHQFQQGTAHSQQQPTQPTQHVPPYQQPATQYPNQVESQPSAQQYNHHPFATQNAPPQDSQHSQTGPDAISPGVNGPVSHFVKPPLPRSMRSSLPKTEVGLDSFPHEPNQVEPVTEEWWEGLKGLDYSENPNLNVRHPANPVAEALPSIMQEEGQLIKLPIAASLPLGVPISQYFRDSGHPAAVPDLVSGLQKDDDPATQGFTDSGMLVSREDLASGQHDMPSHHRELSEESSVENAPHQDAKPVSQQDQNPLAPAAGGIPTPSNSHESEEERLSREQEERLVALGVTGLAKPIRHRSRLTAISTLPTSIAGLPSPAQPGGSHVSPDTDLHFRNARPLPFQNGDSRGNSSAGSPTVDVHRDDLQTPPTIDRFDSRSFGQDSPADLHPRKPNPFDANVKAAMKNLPGFSGSATLKSPDERLDDDRSTVLTHPENQRHGSELQRQSLQRPVEYVRKRSARELSPKTDDGPRRQVDLHTLKAKAKRNAPKVDAAYSRRW